MIDEKKIVASNYIINFYKDVNNLTNTYSQYKNDLLYLKAKYRDLPDLQLHAALLETERQALVQHTSNVRYWALKVYVQVEAIKNKIKIDQKTIEKIDKEYKIIKDQFIIDSENIQEFVVLFNKIIVNSVITTLLQTAESFVNEVYK